MSANSNWVYTCQGFCKYYKSVYEFETSVFQIHSLNREWLIMLKGFNLLSIITVSRCWEWKKLCFLWISHCEIQMKCAIWCECWKLPCTHCCTKCVCGEWMAWNVGAVHEHVNLLNMLSKIVMNKKQWECNWVNEMSKHQNE